MADESFVLSRETAQKLAADHDRLAHEVWNLRKQLDRSRGLVGPVNSYLAYVEDNVAAFDGVQAASSLCEVYKMKRSGGGNDGEIFTTHVKHTVYNMAGAVSAGAWVLITRDAYGTWWFCVENC